MQLLCTLRGRRYRRLTQHSLPSGPLRPSRAGLSPAGPRQPYWRLRLCCPGPSSLNRPDPPHSQAQHNFIALRLICTAFAVRERLGDPRVIPRFYRTILLSMSSSKSPGSRSLHLSSSFATRACLRRELPTARHSRWYPMSGLTGSPLLQPAELLASLTGDFYFRAFDGLVALPAAGYDYGGNWIISTGGTLTHWIDG